MADMEFALDAEEAQQFIEICHEAGETPEAVLVKFAETIVRDEVAREILLAMVGAGEWAKYKYEPAHNELPRTMSPNGEKCAALAADFGACDRCGNYYGCFPDEAPEYLKKYLD